MTIQELFVRSNQTLATVVAQIKPEQWELSMPAAKTANANLKRNVQYHSYDDAWVPDVLAGTAIDDVGDVYAYLLTDDNVQANYTEYNLRAVGVVQNFIDLERLTHLSYGDFPARVYLQHTTCFRAFQAFDIAKLIGTDTYLAPDYVLALLDEFGPLAESYRQAGVFRPVIPVPADASPLTKLLAMTGRK